MNKYTKRGLQVIKGNKKGGIPLGDVPRVGGGGSPPELERIEVGVYGDAVGLKYGAVILGLEPDTADGIAMLLKQVAAKVREIRAAVRAEAEAPVETPAIPECDHAETLERLGKTWCAKCDALMATQKVAPIKHEFDGERAAEQSAREMVATLRGDEDVEPK